MADTLTDSLTATIRSSILWNRTDTQEIGAISQRGNRSTTYTLADGDGAGEADLVFTDTRSIAGGTAEEIDLLNLTQQTLEVPVPFSFGRVRCFRLVNNATAAGHKLRVGIDPARPTVVYAAEVGPGSEFLAVNQTDGYLVTTANSVLRIANPNDVAVSYSLYVLGTKYVEGGSGGS